MLKVLVVDDEPIIRNGLKTIIDWNSYGFEIVGDAADGEEGLKKCAILNPDLVIVDVRMPGMDGLKMVEALQRSGRECEFIILSAYSDFEYARRAMELGVKFYILKPIEEDELIEKLEKIHALIENEKEMKQNISLSRDKALEGIVLGHYENRYNKIYDLEFPWRAYQVAILKLYTEDIAVKEAIKGSISDLILCRYKGYVFDVEGNVVILFENEKYDEIFMYYLTNVLSKLETVLSNRLYMSVGRPVYDIGGINNSYKHARELMEQKFIMAQGNIVLDMKKQRVDTPLYDIDTLRYKLYIAVDSGNSEAVPRFMEQFKDLFIYKKSSEEIIKINYVNLYTMIVDKIRANEGKEANNVYIKEDIVDRAYMAEHIEELHGCIMDRLIELAEELAQKRPYALIEKILDYIDRNYNQDIKLNKMADIFGYNSAYLGKLLKEHTGSTFNDYLNKIRVNKAKQFLQKGLKVSQVAEKVGYNDVDYFYRMFKKYTGFMPSVYKK